MDTNSLLNGVPCAGGMMLGHNPHKASYQTVTDFIESVDGRDDFWYETDYLLADADDELWELHWYPDNPVGFYRIFSNTLDGLLGIYKAHFDDIPDERG